MGLQAASGKYVVDLAADDIMMPDRLKLQVEAFEKLDDSYGMVFTGAVYIDENIKSNYELQRPLSLGKIGHNDYSSVFGNSIGRGCSLRHGICRFLGLERNSN